jgi:hypothetical protein
MTESSLPGPTERIIKWSTAAAVLCVATVAAVVSYDHAYALVRTYGEDGWTARLDPSGISRPRAEGRHHQSASAA